MTLKTAGWTAALSGAAGFLYSMDPNVLVQHMSIIAQSQIAQTGFFFTVAAWLHAGRVKKEIKDSFTGLTESLNSLSAALRQELKIHSDKLADHANKLDNLGRSVAELQSDIKKPLQGEKL